MQDTGRMHDAFFLPSSAFAAFYFGGFCRHLRLPFVPEGITAPQSKTFPLPCGFLEMSALEFLKMSSFLCLLFRPHRAAGTDGYSGDLVPSLSALLHPTASPLCRGEVGLRLGFLTILHLGFGQIWFVLAVFSGRFVLNIFLGYGNPFSMLF